MFDPQENWSDNPNAPKISHTVHFSEKAWVAGNLISSILYGIIIMLFFQCMAAFFNPVHRRGEPIKWGLVTYTVVMLLVVTVGTAAQLDVQSISFVNNREFPGIEDVLPPGPYGYQRFVNPIPVSTVRDVMFVLGNWLADGLLLYRCYVIYSANLWVIAFPCLMYLGSLAMGTVLVCQYTHVNVESSWSGLAYFSISLSLNILLTLMIVIRLILHTRNTRATLGMTGIDRSYKMILIMLVESCALYAVSSLLVIGPLGAGNSVWLLFTPILTETQVIAPLLIIQRVTKKSALTSNTVALRRYYRRVRGQEQMGIDA